MPKGLRNNIIPIALISIVLLYVVFSLSTSNTAVTRINGREPSFTQLVGDIKADKVSRIVEDAPGTTLSVFFKDQVRTQPNYVLAKRSDDSTVTVLSQYGITPDQLSKFEYTQQAESSWARLLSVLLWVLPTLLFLVFMFLMMRRAQGGNDQAFSFGRSRAKRMSSETPVVTFSDVAGCEEAKIELIEVVEFLKSPEKFIQLGARIPKGVLLVGPPGTGKTLLAKAVAGEAGVPFFSLSGSDFVEMFVGVGASRVRDLFEQAKKASPCIVFIDEIDAVGRSRGTGFGGGNDEREQTLNAMLVEMDGFGTDTNVIVLAATNRSDTLDPALMRPGRFDRRVNVPAPDMNGREAILKVHTKGKPLATDIDLMAIAKQIPGFTGADIENLVNEAAIMTARANLKEITQRILQESIEKVVLGPAIKSRLITPRDKRVLAFHEAGHALASVLMPEAEYSLQKVTIIPRGNTGGAAWYAPDNEDSLLNSTRKRMEARMMIGMAGRAAEEIEFDDISAGAVGDIQSVSSMARAMVREYGMSDEIGPVNYSGREAVTYMGRDFSETKQYSEKMSQAIDGEVNRIIRKAHESAVRLLKDNHDKLKTVADALMERETLDSRDFKQILSI